MKEKGKLQSFIEEQLNQGDKSKFFCQIRDLENQFDSHIELIGQTFCRARNDFLMDAVRRGDSAKVGYWLRMGTQPYRQGKAQKSGDPTAFMLAVETDNIVVLRTLLDTDASRRPLKTQIPNALRIANRNKNSEMVSILEELRW